MNDRNNALDLAPAPLLRGTCNRCGQCCRLERGGTVYTCEHLVIGAEIGEPYATRCGVYNVRTHWMPITMTSVTGLRLYANCAADSTPEESRAIIATGIGRGCSLEIVA